MDPEGILNACTTKVLIKRASKIAMTAASAYSRKTPFFPFFFLNDKIPKKTSQKMSNCSQVQGSRFNVQG
jgi:hypothetical protein